MNRELPNVQAGFRKGRGTRDQIANIHWIIEKAREFQKTSLSALLTMPEALTMWITTSCGKFFKRLEYQTIWSPSWEICMQVRKQQLELNMEQQTGSKSGKEYIKAVYSHLAYLIYMQNISCEMLACMKHKLQDCWEKYQQLQICRWHHFMAECEEELKKLLMKVKEENQNVALKLNIEKN